MSIRPVEQRTVCGLLRERLDAAPGETYLRFEDESWTYLDVDLQSREMAAMLARGGVRRGARVVLLMKNSPTYLWALIALARIGAVGVPLNSEAKGDLLAHYLDDSDAGFALVDAEFEDRLATADRDGRLAQVWARDGDRLLDRSADPRGPGEVELDASTHTDPWLLLYTSGTTGRSKAVVVSNAHAVSVALVVAERCELVAEDCLHTCLPLFHINAISYTCLAAMSVGARVAMTERFSVRRFWDDIHRFGATGTNAMGTMIHLLDKREPGPEERDHDLRYILLVPFPADPQGFDRRYGAKIVTTYALTEWIPVSMSLPGEGYDRPEHAGPVLDYTDVKLVDEDGAKVPTGEVGEIWLRAGSAAATFTEYFHRPEESAAAFKDGWFRTRDRGRLDEAGFLYFLGRMGDVIRRRGENISAFEVEAVLRGHPAVVEVAAVPVPSPLGEDDVAVFAALLPGAGQEAEEDLRAFAAANLPRHMLPETIDVLDELPKTATEKIEKYKLIETWERSHASAPTA